MSSSKNSSTALFKAIHLENTMKSKLTHGLRRSIPSVNIWLKWRVKMKLFRIGSRNCLERRRSIRTDWTLLERVEFNHQSRDYQLRAASSYLLFDPSARILRKTDRITQGTLIFTLDPAQHQSRRPHLLLLWLAFLNPKATWQHLDNVVAIRLRHLTRVAIIKGVAIALKEGKVVKEMI